MFTGINNVTIAVLWFVEFLWLRSLRWNANALPSDISVIAGRVDLPLADVTANRGVLKFIFKFFKISPLFYFT
jgi:hypothetical protein